MLTRLFLLAITASTLMLGVVDPTLTVSGSSQAALTQSPPDDFTIEFYPVAPFYIGDNISIRVNYTGSNTIAGQPISVALAEDPHNTLETQTFSSYSQQVVFYWVLDTTELEPGFLNLKFEMPGTENTWQTGINLLPPIKAETKEWASVHSACCTIHYLTGTDAENDIARVQAVLEEKVYEAQSQFFPDGVPTEDFVMEPLTLVLIPIVVGHGGFATDVAVLIYSQRNWAGITFENLAHHEIVHVLDRQLNREGPRPSLLAEGLAVFLSGGHYRDGDPLLRAAAILEQGMYLPLTEITNNFYNAQHEVGYMEAAALVAYLIEIWGWETFLDFYFNLPEGPNDEQIISSALETQFGMDLAALETAFINHLRTLNPDEQVKADVRLTVETYDMLRRYQSTAIPSAHFQTAWWPSVSRMLEEGYVGDYADREKSPFNIIIENLFLEIHSALDGKDYENVEQNLARMDRILSDANGENTPLSHYSMGWPLPLLPWVFTRP